MAGGAALLRFIVTGYDRGASATLKKVAAEARKTDSHMSTFGKTGKFAGLAVAGGLGLAAAAGAAAIPILAGMVKNAAEDEKGQRRLAVALKNTTGARKQDIAGVEEWISKVGVATGVTDDEMRPAFQRLVQSTKDIGSAQKLMGIAMDASAGSGKSLEAVTTAMAKAQNGNMGALSRLGIKIKDTDGKALTFKQTLAQMADTFKGQAAAAANSFDGKMSRLKLVFDETKEAIGAKLIPVLSNLGGWFLSKGIPAIGKMADQIMPKLREAWDSIKKTIDQNRPGLEQFARILGVVGGFILTKVVPAFIKWQSIVARGVVIAIAALGKAIPPVVSSVLRGIATMVGGFRSLLTVTWTVMGGILTAAEKGLGWMPKIGPKIKAAKAGFDNFRSDTISKLRAVEGGLRHTADTVDAFGRKVKAIPEAKIRANISDLQSKLATANRELRNPNLTRERKSQIRANIAQLQDRLAAARRDLASIHSKSVSVMVNVRFGSQYPGGWPQYAREHGIPGYARGGLVTVPHFAAGGMMRGPGTGVSDSMLAAVSAGEWVSTAATVRRYGANTFKAMESGAPIGGTTINVNVYGNPITTKTELAYLVRDAFLDTQRKTGRQLLPTGS